MASNQQPAAPPAFAIAISPPAPAPRAAPSTTPRGFAVRTTSAAAPVAAHAIPPARNQQAVSPYSAVRGTAAPVIAASVIAIARPPPPSNDRLTASNLRQWQRENQSSMPSNSDLSFLTPVRAVEILKWVNDGEAGADWVEEGVDSWWNL